MKFTSVEIGLIALLLLGFLYFYNNPITVYKQKPVYYPVYQNRYVPIRYDYDVFRPRPFHRRMHRSHPAGWKGDWHVGSDGKYLPESKGGVVPIKPFK
tara:strand:- start:45 stop:338 length:294 start_codon:yes stop_codon:yes gene_type:complete